MKDTDTLKPGALRQLTAGELETKGLKLRREQFDLRMQHKSKRLDATHRLRVLRRTVSRIETLLTEKTLEA